MKIDKSLLFTLALLVGGGIVLHWVLQNFSVVLNILGIIWGLLFPFILGLIIAYLFNLPMRSIENLLFKKEKYKKIKRPVSFILTIIVVCAVLALVVFLVVPQLASTIYTLASSMPTYARRIQENLQPYTQYIPQLQEFINNLEIDWKNIINSIFTVLQSGASNFFSSAWGVANSIISGTTSFVIGLIFACYVLFDKERLTRQVHALLKAYCSDKVYNKILDISSLTNRIFSKFVTGQCAEAFAVCLMFLVVLWIGGFDYALLISVLIGFLSLIPIFGAFIGCFVGAFLIFVSSGFWRCIAFIIVFLIVQQIDGNVTYPRIVGNSVGLPPIWVLVAVSVGGGLMGMVGMLIFIPITSVFYSLLRRNAVARLRKKGVEIPEEPESQKPQKKKFNLKQLFNRDKK